VQIAAVRYCEQKNSAISGKLIIAVYASYVCKISALNARSPQGFQSHKNMTFQIIRMNILTFATVREKVYGSRMAINRSLNMEELDRKRKTFRLVIVECRLGLRRVRIGYVKINK
jgi:hypothetical protein